MTLRIYWVPHTVCPFGCQHCHNDSSPRAARPDLARLLHLVSQLPAADSTLHIEEILIGGGEGVAPNAGVEQLVRALRQRYPSHARGSLAERRANGEVIIAIQTAGPPLADAHGVVAPERVQAWVDLGVDYFQVASSDRFHRASQPRYPWEALESSLHVYEAAHGVPFVIYGKEITRLVPSGRVLDNWPALSALGASLLTAHDYCATGWETGSRFLSGVGQAYPSCAEVVIAPDGWVHPCCWYQLSPGLFDLVATTLETGIAALAAEPLCLAIDRGDMLALADLAGLDDAQARQVREAVGDCGLCRLASLRLVRGAASGWLQAQPLDEREQAFYTASLGDDLAQLFARDDLGGGCGA